MWLAGTSPGWTRALTKKTGFAGSPSSAASEATVNTSRLRPWRDRPRTSLLKYIAEVEAAAWVDIRSRNAWQSR